MFCIACSVSVLTIWLKTGLQGKETPSYYPAVDIFRIFLNSSHFKYLEVGGVLRTFFSVSVFPVSLMSAIVQSSNSYPIKLVI